MGAEEGREMRVEKRAEQRDMSSKLNGRKRGGR